MIHLIVLPGRLSINLHNARVSYADPAMAAMIDTRTDNYEMTWACLYLCEVWLTAVFLFVSVVLLVLFFTRHRAFPRAFTVFAIAAVCVNTIVLILAHMASHSSSEYRYQIVMQATRIGGVDSLGHVPATLAPRAKRVSMMRTGSNLE
jgi:hypothetical protein